MINIFFLLLSIRHNNLPKSTKCFTIFVAIFDLSVSMSENIFYLLFIEDF